GGRVPHPSGRRDRCRLRPGRGGARDESEGARAPARDRAGGRRGDGAMTRRVLLVDNYDSFTYNLAQAFGALGAEVTVLRADDPALAAGLGARPERPVTAPGPGPPQAAGRAPALVR